MKILTPFHAKIQERIAISHLSGKALRGILNVIRIGPLLILVAECIVLFFFIDVPRLSVGNGGIFISVVNMSNVLTQTATVSILAVGMLLVIVTAGIDLSVGSVMAMASVVGAVTWRALTGGTSDPAGASGWGTLLVVLATLAMGGMAGFVNGFAFVKGKMAHPFIPTLTMLYVARGLALLWSDGRPVPGVPQLVLNLSKTRFGLFGRAGIIPMPIIIVLGLVLLTYLLSTRIKWGRWIYAVGGNVESARRMGIKVDRVLISVYVFCGVCAGLAALVGIMGRTNSGYPTAGNLFELRAIAAVIIGGASFFGGRGNVINALLGSLILGVTQNGLNLIGAQAYWELIATGIIISVAVELDVVRRAVERRLSSLQAPIDRSGF